jgi:diguanylate cyclase (GGDEF)-like protein
MLERQMRSDDLVARYGGDEFVAYMRCDREIGLERAAEIRETLENCGIAWEGKTIHITASIGLHCQPLRDGIDVEQLLHQADIAMYQAKKGGRNRVVDITR